MKVREILLGRVLIGRRFYLFAGLGLAVVKFNLDRILALSGWNEAISIFHPETMRLYLWQMVPAGENWELGAAMLLWSLPFLWLGVILTLGRLRSAGLSPWWVVLFVVPGVKLVLFAVLLALPPKTHVPIPAGEGPLSTRIGRLIPRSPGGSALAAVVIAAAGALAVTWFGTTVLGSYGWTLFVAAPFVLGFVTVLIFGFHAPRELSTALQVAAVATVFAGGALLLFAFEGMICILMAAPLALLLALTGGMVSWAILNLRRWPAHSGNVLGAAVLALPLSLGLEEVAPPELPLLAVRSAVIVDAPPERVWRHVVEFSELPPPDELIFRLGVAYPVRAEIHGHGVGAVRHCTFSTGPFVEPIEVWDEPRLLAFSVTKNPEPMQEWTPYRDVHPRHLDGYLESKRGQFRLEALPGGRTRLEGTTWYHHHLWPAGYWQIWSDYIIHRIHLRVLQHVKALAESDHTEGVAP